VRVRDQDVMVSIDRLKPAFIIIEGLTGGETLMPGSTTSGHNNNKDASSK